MKYAWIQKQRDWFPIRTMCRVLQVSSSGFYKWLKAKPGPRACRSAAIKADVLQVHESSRGIYGSCKIAEKLKTDEGLETACRNTVAKAMQEMGLKSRVSKQFKPTTTVSDPARKPAPNVIQQDFQATKCPRTQSAKNAKEKCPQRTGKLGLRRGAEWRLNWARRRRMTNDDGKKRTGGC